MAVHNRTLRLGYVNLIYPILTECGVDLSKWLTCDQPGIAAEIWRVLFPYLNYSSIEFVKIDTFGVVANSTATPDSLFDQLHKGKVDASYQFTIYENDERFGYVLYSAPVSTYHFGFVAGDLIDNKQSSLKIEVFQRLPLMLLVLLTLFFGLVHGMINGNIRDGVWRGLSSACMQFKDDPHGIRNPIIVMGYAVLLINYFAGFRGQALSMTISQSPLFQMDHIRQNLGTGKVLLIIAGSTDLGLVARKLLFGNENADLRKFGTIEESNFTLAADVLCNRRDVLFFGSVESLRWGSKQKNCWLRT
uniref:Uncharacterized protein n=1 Tax=Plectus sambesii TaxID=2011161 RepID=A0A914VAF1_9BILA